MKMVNNNYKYLLFGFLGLTFLARSFDYFSSGNPSDLIWVSLGLFIILPLFIRKNKYCAKILFTFFMCIITTTGLILIYTYLFEPLYVLTLTYCASIAFFVLYIIIFIYYYPRKWKGFLPKWMVSG